jgi:hypothetical protein
MEWLDMVGELMNGVLQIYLGYKITNENVNVVVGQSISEKEMIDLMKVIDDREKIV